MTSGKRIYNFVLIEESVQVALLVGAIPVMENILKKFKHTINKMEDTY